MTASEAAQAEAESDGPVAAATTAVIAEESKEEETKVQ